MLCKWTDHAASDWLTTPFGRSLLEQEARVVEAALDGMFGEQLLQLGLWGGANQFVRYARTQHSALLTDCLPDKPATVTCIGADLHKLPVESESVDAVILPHTVDYAEHPHAVLREVNRVLRSSGQLVLLGFRPGGLWGLRRLVPGAGLPPGVDQLVSERRLRDWLALLDLRIQSHSGYFFRWPLPGLASPASQAWEHRGRRWWPELSACYLLTAQKRVSTLTPVRPVWRKKPKVVTGLAEPSTRASRIRFEPRN